jgi:hypothetical protein
MGNHKQIKVADEERHKVDKLKEDTKKMIQNMVDGRVKNRNPEKILSSHIFNGFNAY